MLLRYPGPWFLMKIAAVAVVVVFAPGACSIRVPDQQNAAKWTANGFYSYPHPKERQHLPQEVMVEVINGLGLQMLAIHNENNENNVALSPYGALSVLVILGEGLQGEAVREVQDAAKLPNDISVIRVGLRDIYKHLKAYFFPKEGFLAGLTLNHENITFRPEYIDVLKFYGYDISAFNNALFPDSEGATTDAPQETSIPVDTTVATTDMLDSDGSETTTAVATTTKAATTTSKVTEFPRTATTAAILSEAATVITETPKVVPDTTAVTTTTTTEKLTTAAVTEAPTTTTTEKSTTTTATTTVPTTTLPTTKQPTTTTEATTTIQPTTTTTTESTTIVLDDETTTSSSTEGDEETEIVTEIVTEFFTEIIEEEPTEVSELGYRR
nr:unnamed protein product [Callosobruchus analis]